LMNYKSAEPSMFLSFAQKRGIITGSSLINTKKNDKFQYFDQNLSIEHNCLKKELALLQPPSVCIASCQTTKYNILKII
jgi:hypothetical protein